MAGRHAAAGRVGTVGESQDPRVGVRGEAQAARRGHVRAQQGGGGGVRAGHVSAAG